MAGSASGKSVPTRVAVSEVRGCDSFQERAFDGRDGKNRIDHARSIFLYIPANVWKDALRDYFQKHLSMQEQLDSLAFLQSAAGKKFLSMQIQTGNEVGGQVARHLHQHQEDFGDSLAKRLTAEFPELLR
jgi:hypothetical protein